MSPKNTIFIQAGWVGGEAACSVGEGAWSETSFLLVDIKTKTKTKTTNKAIQWKKDYQRTLFLLKSIHFVNLSNIGKGLSCTGGNSTTQGAVRLHRLLKCRWEKESETKVFEQKPGMRDGLDVLHHHLCPIARWSAKLIEEKRWGESSFGFQRRNAQVCRVKCGQGRVSPSAYARWQIKELSLADWGLYFLPSTKRDHVYVTRRCERDRSGWEARWSRLLLPCRPSCRWTLMEKLICSFQELCSQSQRWNCGLLWHWGGSDAMQPQVHIISLSYY